MYAAGGVGFSAPDIVRVLLLSWPSFSCCASGCHGMDWTVTCSLRFDLYVSAAGRSALTND